MLRNLIPVLLIAFSSNILLGQSETYSVKKTEFSTDEYDEFSPVFYKNSIVFCTNRNPSIVSEYYNQENKGLFKIYYVDTTSSENWQRPRLFSKSLTSHFNDGPVTFNSLGDTIYFSRNQEVGGKLYGNSKLRNNLGIFYAVLSGQKWTKIRDLRINDEWYNVTTPWLSPDGRKLYFASDKPGGYGGSDLYYTEWKGGYWNEPVNLGPQINTEGNEVYPYINPAGELLFSSDGHHGFGGKDIYFSRFSDSAWLKPVLLDEPINSEFDDFGIITDTLMGEGYFSSNRGKSIDIYHFKTIYPQIFYSGIQNENQYCFRFNDDGEIVIDTLNLKYIWDFGDGEKASGRTVSHCYTGPGNYLVKLDIVERSNGRLFFSKLDYSLELRDFQQPYINSPSYGLKGDLMKFDALKSYLPGFEILSYSWAFGDGVRSSGKSVEHKYNEKGEYIVNLGLTLKSLTTGNVHGTGVSKKISIFDNKNVMDTYVSEKAAVKPLLTDIRNYENARIQIQYSAENELKKEAVFCIELVSSKNKISLAGSEFGKIPDKYTIEERFNPEDSSYSYVIDRQMSLMATYPAFKEISDLGFNKARIKILLLRNDAEKELFNLIKIYGALADSYFDSSENLTSNAYIMLDQVVKLMDKYPSLKIEIAVHTDNIGSEAANLALTQQRAKILVDYLINRGISSQRVIPKGFGDLKPIAPNFLEKDRILNRRIDFRIIN